MRKRHKDPDYRRKKNEANRKHRLRNPEAELLRGARRRAKQYGVPFALTIDDIYIPTRCPALGIPLEAGGGSLDNSPSLDRFIPELGYVPGNVAVISRLANCIKSSATAPEVRAVADWMKETHQTTKEKT